MAKNIGFSKREAKDTADTLNCQDAWDAYVQREDHWPRDPKTSVIGKCQWTYQWIVVVQKKSKRSI